MTTNFSKDRVNRDGRTYDNLLLLEDGAAAITVSGVGSDIVTLGTGLVKGIVQMDVSAVEVDTGDEIYTIAVELSTESDFATYVGDAGATIVLGDATQLAGNRDLGAGRYSLPVSNMVNGVIYPYMRLYVTIAGSIVTGITFTAFLAKEPA